MNIILIVYIVLCGNNQIYINGSGRGPHMSNVAEEKKNKERKVNHVRNHLEVFGIYTNCKYKHQPALMFQCEGTHRKSNFLRLAYDKH